MTEREKQRALRRVAAELIFYAAERRIGTPPDVAYDRAQEFLKRFDQPEGETSERAA